MLYFDQVPPQWWIDLQVAKELDIRYSRVLKIPITEYYVGYISLMIKGMLNKGSKKKPPKRQALSNKTPSTKG